jgi:protoporphyrinogen oxidase
MVANNFSSLINHSFWGNKMQFTIVGNGLMGISLGYFLTQKGISVEIFETPPFFGGLTGPVNLEDGAVVDPCFEPILSIDGELLHLCAELGIADQLQSRQTNLGFFIDGKIHPMNHVSELMQFLPLGWVDRLRLGRTLLQARSVKDWYQLENINAKEWLIRWGGQRVFEKFWQPMLKARFDGHTSQIPATYVWAWLARMAVNRSSIETQFLTGGNNILRREMIKQIEAAGGVIHHDNPVQTVIIEQNRVRKIRLLQETRPLESVAITTQLPQFRRLLAGNRPDYDQFLKKTESLGNICLLLVLDQPLTEYSTISICDDTTPFEQIDITTYADTQNHDPDRHYLVYLSKSTTPGSPWQDKTEEEIKADWLQHLERMFPNFDKNRINYNVINRTRHAEPFHQVNSSHLIPNIRTPIENLYLATTDQIYPLPTTGEAIIEQAEQVTQMIVEDMTGATP